MSQATPISPEDFRRLHPRAIERRSAILDLLHQLQRDASPLWRSTDHFSEQETAMVVCVDDTSFVLETQNFNLSNETQVFLNFQVSGQPYFLSSPLLEVSGDSRIRLTLPAVIYQAERRDRARTPSKGIVRLLGPSDLICNAQLADTSADGIAVDVPVALDLPRGTWLRVQPESSEQRAGFAEVRHVQRSSRTRSQRLGLSLIPQRPSASVLLEHVELRQETILAAAPPESLLDARVPTVRYTNDAGEHLSAIIDTHGDPSNATAVIIPSAWGRTKETLLPLAATILETFRSNGAPVTVVRFDGIRKRGESYLDPECRRPGLENLHFTFSQGVRDILATVSFLQRSRFRPLSIVLVTFSVSSIEGRRAMVIAGPQIAGWISVVGSADAQSLTRVISGGVDFFGGSERGVKFGHQEIQGMLVDMDHAASDALDHRLAFLDDSRRDFLTITAPITWIHGQHDAWMDIERVKHVLQFGTTENRRILSVPTGHQLRTSEEALSTFELIASEAGRMALGRGISSRRPDPFDLANRAQAERARLQRGPVDLKKFWRDYLVGRSFGPGIALVASTMPYRMLMATQIEALALDDGHAVADLGCGIGTFAAHLLESPDLQKLRRLKITALDYVHEALGTARQQLASKPQRAGIELSWIQATLDVAGPHSFIPLRSQSQDSVLLSLVLNYVASPGALLREVHRVLKPGGRLVLSSLKRDADISRICVDAVSELQQGRGREVFGPEGEKGLSGALQCFISDASRLLDLEEAGQFHFWNEAELLAMIEAAGFAIIKRSRGLGAVPQAHVVTAHC